MQRLLKISFLSLVFTLIVQAGFCQVLPPLPNPSDGAPIDGMSSLLLVLGFGYGALKMKVNKIK